jgi:SpoVK/Ycf46/Vps4 family AAA+-type ATPase
MLWTEGYSSADLNSICKEAAMEPVREIPPNKIMQIQSANQVRKVLLKDFEKAIRNNQPSVSKASI